MKLIEIELEVMLNTHELELEKIGIKRIGIDANELI